MQEPEVKILESIIGDLATQLQVEPETIRPFLLYTYHEIWTEAVIKDFVPIFAMRLVRDNFSGIRSKKNQLVQPSVFFPSQRIRKDK